MELNKIMEIDAEYYMNTFGKRIPVAFDRGKGMYLYTEEGEEYLDMFAGIAVTALGHCHEGFTKAITEQAGKLLHTSSIYYIKNQALLAKRICDASVADRVFFCNSGAEANEGAMKLAKIYYYKQGKEKYEIITLNSSFHGRTLATVAATGQPKYQKPYKPLIPGIKHVDINDFEALEAAVTDNTCAIMLEVVQGESGVHLCTDEYLMKVRRLCDEKDILLIFDEVQTGMGRTGKMFAYQTTPVEPDIFTLAKALGNGVPIGALCAKEFAAKGFEPGDHGGTFGGNPLATAAGMAVFDAFEKEHICENAAAMGEYFEERLRAINSPQILEIRRKGLMIGVQMPDGMAKEAQEKLFARRVLVGSCGGHTLRILPPLIIKKEHIDKFISELEAVL